MTIKEYWRTFLKEKGLPDDLKYLEAFGFGMDPQENDELLELVLSGKIANKNLKMTKVSMIAEQVGQCPVLSFGNSAGDISMTNYVMGNGQYRTAAFFVCCDDDIRESGSLRKAQPVYDSARRTAGFPFR